MAEEACKEVGLSCEEYTVPSSNEIQSVVESMVGKVDVIYAPTDNVIAAGMSTVAMIATDNQIPVICGEAGMVNAGDCHLRHRLLPAGLHDRPAGGEDPYRRGVTCRHAD